MELDHAIPLYQSGAVTGWLDGVGIIPLMHGIINFLLHFMGVKPRTPSTAYNFWSGFGSDLGEFAIVGLIWRRLNCHSKGCYRLGLHHVPGTGYVTCRKHHPTVPDQGATAEEIQAAHRAAN